MVARIPDFDRSWFPILSSSVDPLHCFTNKHTFSKFGGRTRPFATCLSFPRSLAICTSSKKFQFPFQVPVPVLLPVPVPVSAFPVSGFQFPVSGFRFPASSFRQFCVNANMWRRKRKICHRGRDLPFFPKTTESVVFGVDRAIRQKMEDRSLWVIQRIVSHPQQEAVQNDLEQQQSFNAFSDESKVAIMDAGNTEICKIVNVEPKWQCKVCLKHCSTGVIYCTCGHLMTKDSAENRRYISAVLDTFSISNFYIRKNRPHGHRYGKAPGCKDHFSANQLAKKCRKKKYDSIHDRYIRDKTFRKSMIEVGRSEQMIKEMDKLASEDHTYKANKEEIEFYRGNWWIHTNVAHFDSVPTRYEPEFKNALSTMQRLKRAEDKKKQETLTQNSSSSSSWHWHASWWESDFEYSPQRWYDH